MVWAVGVPSVKSLRKRGKGKEQRRGKQRRALRKKRRLRAKAVVRSKKKGKTVFFGQLPGRWGGAARRGRAVN